MSVDVMEKLSAAPRSFEYKGVRYELSPLGVRDVAQMKSFVKKFLTAQASETANLLRIAGAPPEVVAEVWSKCAAACERPLQACNIQEPEPALEFTFMSLRKRHPSITPDDVATMLEDPAIQQLMFEENAALNSAEVDVKN